MGPSHVEDPEQLKYLNILFDFAYLKSPEDFENMVNSNTVCDPATLLMVPDFGLNGMNCELFKLGTAGR